MHALWNMQLSMVCFVVWTQVSTQFRDQIAAARQEAVQEGEAQQRQLQHAQADLCVQLEEAQQSVTLLVESNNDLKADLDKVRQERDSVKNKVVAVQQENQKLNDRWNHRSIISKTFG